MATKIMSLDEPAFGMGEACRLAHLDPQRAYVWDQRKKINLGRRVNAKRRLLSTWQVLELALIARLASAVSIEDAARWAADGVQQLRQLRPCDVDTLEGLKAELERGGDTHALFVFIQPDNLRVLVQGNLTTLAELARDGGKADASARTALITIPIAQILYQIVEMARELAKKEPEVA